MGRHGWTRTIGAALTLLLGTLAMVPTTSAVEPDDRIAYARLLEGGGAEIFVADPDGSDEQLVPLENLAEDFTILPVWSPDHAWLLISHVMLFGDFPRWRPSIVRPDGSEYRLLSVPAGPDGMDCTAWSADGTRILPGSFGGDEPDLQHPVYGRRRRAAPDRSSVPAQWRGYARGRIARRLAASLHPQEARAGPGSAAIPDGAVRVVHDQHGRIERTPARSVRRDAGPRDHGRPLVARWEDHHLSEQARKAVHGQRGRRPAPYS